MSPKVTIIVPVYNAEKFLKDCLDSIKVQSFRDFEVILVEDGSTDNSLEILVSYRNGDNRFLLLQQGHSGVSAARNTGLKYATGDYVCFVDADDQLAPTYLEDLYYAMGEHSDSSMGGFKKIDMLSQDDCEVVPEKGIENLEENLLGFYAANNTDWQRYIWNRMFKMSVIRDNNIQFREDIYYKEDGLFLIQYLCASNGMVGCADKVLYYYYRNTTGAMSKTWHTFDEKIITNLEAHRLIIEKLKRSHVSELVLTKAKGQAKAAYNWIFQMMWQTKSFSLNRVKRIDNIMISILGIIGYLSWRSVQLLRLFR